MKPEHEKHILENAGHKSAEAITPAKKKTVILSVLLIVALGFAVYGNSLNGEFIWDDESLVENNTYIKDWSHIPQIFSENIGAGSGKKYRSYRPLQIITYTVDHSLWKLNIRGYHLTNTLLHIFAALGIYWLINTLFNDNLLSLLTGSFFVVHPIHTEAVTYISGRADSLSLLFMLLCFLFYIKNLSSRNAGMYVLMLLSYGAALLSKENSLILPVLLVLYHYSFKKKVESKELLSIVSVAFIYVLLRVTVLKTLLTSVVSTTTTLPQRLPGFFVAVTNYIRLLFLPLNLHMEYGIVLFNPGNLKAILGAVLLFVLLIYAFRRKENNKLVFFSIAWFFVAILPVSNLYPVNAYMAEHWLYVPSIGFFLIVAKAICWLYRVKNYRTFTTIIAIGLLVFYSCLTIRQNIFWRNPLSYFQEILKYAPNSPRVNYNLGNAYKDINKREEAVTLYKKAIELKADYADAYYNLGIVYDAMDKREEAVTAYKKAIEIKPGFAKAYYNLGNVYNTIEKREEAVTAYKKATEIKADYAMAYYNLGNSYNTMDKTEEAVAAYKMAIEIKSDFAEAYYNLGTVYKGLNQNEEAITLYKKAIKSKPDYEKAYNSLSSLYAHTGKKVEAEAAYKKAIESKTGYAATYNSRGIVYKDLTKNERIIAALKKIIETEPDNAKAYNNLGSVYKDLKNNEEAIVLYKKAIELKPDYAMAYYNLGNIYNTLKKTEEAVGSYKKAIEIDPNFAEAHGNISVNYFYQEKYQLAIQHYDKAKEFGFVNESISQALEPYRK